VVIQIKYENAGHWRIFTTEAPSYTISTMLRPVTEYKHLYTANKSGDEREIAKAYGILIVLQQGGHIVTFSAIHALMVLTAALGLLAVSNVLTDAIAIHIMPNSAVYGALKYQDSEDLVTVKETPDGAAEVSGLS